jgi:hypothetical protein
MLRQNIGQEGAGRAPTGEARHLAQDVQHRIANDARARLPPASSGVGQNLAAAAILLRAMPEPSTTEGRHILGELKNLLEDAAVRRAESSASRRQGYPPEHRAATSRFMREASVHTGRTRDTAPAAPGRLGNEHHRRDCRAHLDDKVRRGYHPRRGGRYDSGEDRSPLPEPPGPQAFSRAIRRAPFSTRFRTPTTITKYSGETRPELWLADYRLEWTMTTSSSTPPPVPLRRRPSLAGASAPCADLQLGRPGQSFHRQLPGHIRAPWELLGISEAAASSWENPSGTTFGDFRSSAPSCPTSPTQMSSARSSPAPLAATW